MCLRGYVSEDLLGLCFVTASQLVGIGDHLVAGERVTQHEQGGAEAADCRDGGREGVQVIDDGLRLNGTTLGCLLYTSDAADE